MFKSFFRIIRPRLRQFFIGRRLDPKLERFTRYVNLCTPDGRNSDKAMGGGDTFPDVKAGLDTWLDCEDNIISKNYVEWIGVPYNRYDGDSRPSICTLNAGEFEADGSLTAPFLMHGMAKDTLPPPKTYGRYPPTKFLVVDYDDTVWPRIIFCAEWCADKNNFKTFPLCGVNARRGLIDQAIGGARVDRSLAQHAARVKLKDEEKQKRKEEMAKKRQTGEYHDSKDDPPAL